jgi:hypothetical protein
MPEFKFKMQAKLAPSCRRPSPRRHRRFMKTPRLRPVGQGISGSRESRIGSSNLPPFNEFSRECGAAWPRFRYPKGWALPRKA